MRHVAYGILMLGLLARRNAHEANRFVDPDCAAALWPRTRVRTLGLKVPSYRVRYIAYATQSILPGRNQAQTGDL